MSVRLKNVKTGVIVSVADEKVSRLGSEWEPVEKPKPAPRAKKKTEDNDEQ